jgi:hypothetical protein
MKKTILISTLALAVLPLIAADAGGKDDVLAAAKKLGEQSYSWKTTVVVPEGARMRPGPTEGKIEKDGTAYVSSAFADNKTETVIKGGKAAVLRDGEWKSVADLENEQGPGRFQAMMARSFKAPAEQAAEIAGYVKDLKKDGDVYSGTLSEEGVKALVSFRRAGREPRPVSDPSGTAKFWLKDGSLSKYEFQVKGTTKNQNGEDMPVDRATTVEIKDVGKTKVEIPEAAAKKLS